MAAAIICPPIDDASGALFVVMGSYTSGSSNCLLLETGDYLLLENGDHLEFE